MSQLSLNSITIRRSTTDDPFIYLGAVVPSQSGYFLPRLFYDTTQIDTILGEFEYSQMYKDLIGRGIPLCLLPVTTKSSKYNRASLRINSQVRSSSSQSFRTSTSITKIPYCHPKYKKEYTQKETSLSSFKLINLGLEGFGFVLDFTNVSLGSLLSTGNYIVINTGYVTGNDSYDQLIKTPGVSGISSSYYNSTPTTESSFNSTGTIHLAPNSVLTAMENLTDNWNSADWNLNSKGSVCYTVDSYVTEFITNYAIANGSPFPTTDYADWCTGLSESAYPYDFWMIDSYHVADAINLVAEYQSLTAISLAEFCTLVVNNIDNSLKLKVFIKNKFQSYNPNLIKMTGGSVSLVNNYSQDVLSESSNEDKLVEFYAKMKGPAGENITVTTSVADESKNLFNIIISNNIISESYLVYLYNNGNITNSDAIHITDISKKSDLVDVVIYNYWEQTGSTYKLIDDRFIEFNETYTSDNIRDNSELVLPAGTFTLGRYNQEEYTQDDYINSYEIYKTSEWYPDLFLVPTLEYTKSNSSSISGTNLDLVLDSILDLVGVNSQTGVTASNPTDSIFSQALINLNGVDLNPNYYYSKQFKSTNNKLLYFYGNPTITGIEYPSFYPYIYNLIYQKYLDYPANGILCDKFSLRVGNDMYLQSTFKDITEVEKFQLLSSGEYYIKFTQTNKGAGSDNVTLFPDNVDLSITRLKTFIESHKINYLKYDNLKYYWTSIEEVEGQPSVFMIEYILSKYTREVFKIYHKLIGIHEEEVRDILNDMMTECSEQLSLVNSSNFEVTFSESSPNTLSVSIELEIPKLVNKIYKLDIILNV